MPLTESQAKSLLEQAKVRKPDLTSNEARQILDQANISLLSKPKELTSDEKIARIQKITPEEFASLPGRQKVTASLYRRGGQPKTGLEKGLETAGTIGEVGALTGAGFLGTLIGGKKGSSILTGATKAGTSTIREAYQSITGRQDQPILESGIAPFKDAALAAGIDYALGLGTEKVAGAINVAKRKFGKAVVGEVVSNAGASNVKNATLRHAFDPKEELINRGIMTEDWWKPQFGNKRFPYKGRKIVSDKIGEAEKVISQSIKDSGLGRSAIMTKDAAKKSLKASAFSIAEFSGSTYDDVIKAGNEIIEGVFKTNGTRNVLTAKQSLAAKRALFDNSFKKGGVPYSGLEKQVKYRLGMAINSNLKDVVPGVKSGLREEEILINLGQILDSAFVKSYQNESKTIAAGLSSAELSSIAETIWQSSFAFGVNPLAGTVVAAAKTPSLILKIFGSPETAKKMLSTGKGEISKKALGAGKFVQALGLSSIGK